MGLKDLLKKKQSSIVKKWFEFVIDTYAPDAALFFKNQSDSFLNPVGGTTRTILETLYGALLEKADADPDGWKPKREREVSKALKAYASMVSSADQGAIRVI